MKTKDMLWGLCLLLIGIAIGYYYATKIRPKTIAMKFNPVGEMLVEAKTGDHLNWFDGNGAATGVKFRYGLNPCTNSGDAANGTCTMKDSAVYEFKCVANGCPDPGVGGGDDTFRGSGNGSGHLDPPYADPGPKSVNVYCDPSTATATADPPLVQGKQGTAFTLQLVGATDFTATFPTGTCDPGDSLNSGSPNCRIKPVVGADTTYNYTISISGCTTAGTAMLKELMP